MRMLILHRTHVKSYSENKVVVYINGKIAAKLKDNETKELGIEEDSVIIQAKVLKWFGSPKQTIALTDHTVVNIDFLPNFYNQTFIYSNLFIATSVLLRDFLKLTSYIFAALGFGVLLFSIFCRRNKWLSLTIK